MEDLAQQICTSADLGAPPIDSTTPHFERLREVGLGLRAEGEEKDWGFGKENMGSSGRKLDGEERSEKKSRKVKREEEKEGAAKMGQAVVRTVETKGDGSARPTRG